VHPSDGKYFFLAWKFGVATPNGPTAKFVAKISGRKAFRPGKLKCELALRASSHQASSSCIGSNTVQIMGSAAALFMFMEP
jgi:hypothetical protein